MITIYDTQYIQAVNQIASQYKTSIPNKEFIDKVLRTYVRLSLDKIIPDFKLAVEKNFNQNEVNKIVNKIGSSIGSNDKTQIEFIMNAMRTQFGNGFISPFIAEPQKNNAIVSQQQKDAPYTDTLERAEKAIEDATQKGTKLLLSPVTGIVDNSVKNLFQSPVIVIAFIILILILLAIGFTYIKGITKT